MSGGVTSVWFPANSIGHQGQCFNRFLRSDDFQNYQKKIGKNKAVGGRWDLSGSRGFLGDACTGSGVGFLNFSTLDILGFGPCFIVGICPEHCGVV